MEVRLGTEEWPRGAPGSAHGAGWAVSPRSFPGALVPPTPPGHRGARAAARQPASSAAWARAGCFAVCASVSPSQNESDARIYRLSLKVERAHSAPVAWSCAAHTWFVASARGSQSTLTGGLCDPRPLRLLTGEDASPGRSGGLPKATQLEGDQGALEPISLEPKGDHLLPSDPVTKSYRPTVPPCARQRTQPRTLHLDRQRRSWILF